MLNIIDFNVVVLPDALGPVMIKFLSKLILFLTISDSDKLFLSKRGG